MQLIGSIAPVVALCHHIVHNHVRQCSHTQRHREKVEQKRYFPGAVHHQQTQNSTYRPRCTHNGHIGRVKNMARKQAHRSAGKKHKQQPPGSCYFLKRSPEQKQEQHVAQQVAYAAVYQQRGRQSPPLAVLHKTRVPECQQIIVPEAKRINHEAQKYQQPGCLTAPPGGR